MLLRKRARAPSCVLGFETGATFSLSVYSGQLSFLPPEQAGQAEIRLEPSFLRHEFDRFVFLSVPIPVL